MRVAPKQSWEIAQQAHQKHWSQRRNVEAVTAQMLCVRMAAVIHVKKSAKPTSRWAGAWSMSRRLTNVSAKAGWSDSRRNPTKAATFTGI